MAFLKTASALTVATVIAQGLMLLSLYVMVKEYSQADVGIYSIFAAAAAIIGLVAMLSYELLLPNIDEDDYSPFVQTLLFLAALLSVLFWLGAEVVGYRLAAELGLVVFSFSVIRLIEYTRIRSGRLRAIYLLRVLPPLVLFVWVTVIWSGLITLSMDQAILAYAMSVFAIAIMLNLVLMKREFVCTPWLLRQGMDLLRLKLSHALHVAPSSLLNTLSYNLPVILLGKFFSPELAAQYNVILRFCFAPVSLLGDAIGKVFHSHLADYTRRDSAGGYESYRKIRNYLLFAGFASGLLIALLFPALVPYLLGEEWSMAGEMGMWMSPLFAIMLCVAPLSVSLYVFEQGAYLLRSQLAYFLISLISFVIGIAWQDIWIAIALFTWLSVLRYGHMWYRIRKLSIQRLSA